jgi:hypothetical protein
MAKLRNMLAWVGVLGLVACGGATDPESPPAQAAPPGAADTPAPTDDVVPPANALPPGNAATPDSEVESRQVDGVWLFSHAQTNHTDALLVGPATIADGCLLVADYAVVWHESWMGDITQAIASVRAGNPVTVRTGGGEVGPTWLAAIRERCPDARGGWSASPKGE